MGIGELFSTFGENYVQALLQTWSMTAISFACALAIGLVITVFRVSPVKPLRIVGDLYVQIFRNIPTVDVITSGEENVYELLDNKFLIFEQDALKKLEEAMA